MSGQQANAAISELALLRGLPPRPPHDLDRVLDATERCLARYGLRRTSMTDIAKEMGVSRPTLYKQVASLADAIALVGSRQFYRFLDELVGLLGRDVGPDTFIDATVRAVTIALTDPVVVRIINDEPELVGEAFATGRLPDLAEEITDALTPVFDAAMATGAIRPGDPRRAAGLMVRLVASLVAMPAGADLEPLVRYALEPVLAPVDDLSGSAMAEVAR